MRILDVRIDNVNMAEAVAQAEVLFRDTAPQYIATPNPEFLIIARRNENFKEILNQAGLCLPDGIGLVAASWLLGRPLKGRVAGADFLTAFSARAARMGWPVLLLGGGPGVAQRAALNLRRRHNALKVRALDNRCLDFPENIASDSPCILFIALGAPKQEFWIARHLKEMPQVGLAVGVGGTLDFLAGEVRRAPLVFRCCGMEWLWRLAAQPRRIKRTLKSIFVFPWLVLTSDFLRRQ